WMAFMLFRLVVPTLVQEHKTVMKKPLFFKVP
ncbi:MAG: hypothetical protein ACI9V8_002264, partial [Urechidicola sp.]